MQYLYIIKCLDFHKIGIANDVESRLAQLSTGNPYPLEVVVVYAFDNAEIVERSIHQRYRENKQRGEWFSLDYEALKNIHSVCLALGGRAFEYTGQDATEENIEAAEKEIEYCLIGGDTWRLEARNDSSVPRYAIMQRGSEKKCIGYLGIRDMKDPYNPSVEEVEVVLTRLAESEKK